MLHKVFCAQFEKVLSLPSGRVGELLLAFIPHLDLYSEFIRNHDRATKVGALVFIYLSICFLFFCLRVCLFVYLFIYSWYVI